jgi:F-type H+-transporting ATPase subunit delta
MSDESVARRYAAALFHQVRTKGTLTETLADMNRVSTLLKATPELGALIGHPLVTATRKKAAVETAFSKTVGAATLGLLHLLIDKRRSELLADVQIEFERLVREFQNVASASAISATPLTAAQLTALEKALETRTGKDIELTTSVDPSLIGGVLVRIGDTVLDGTVRGNLERLREQLLVKK